MGNESLCLCAVLYGVFTAKSVYIDSNALRFTLTYLHCVVCNLQYHSALLDSIISLCLNCYLRFLSLCGEDRLSTQGYSCRASAHYLTSVTSVSQLLPRFHCLWNSDQ